MASRVEHSRPPPHSAAWIASLALAGSLALILTLLTGAEMASVGEPVSWPGIAFGQTLDAALLVVAFGIAWRIANAAHGRGMSLFTSAGVQAAAVIVVSLLCLATFTAVCEIAVIANFQEARTVGVGFGHELWRVALLSALANMLIAWGGAKTRPDQTAPEPSDLLSFRDGGVTYVHRRSEIRWVEAQGNYARLHLVDGRRMMRTTMGDLAGQLGEGFVRIHRTKIVNRAAVSRLERIDGRAVVVLDDGTEITVGRRWLRTVIAQL